MSDARHLPPARYARMFFARVSFPGRARGVAVGGSVVNRATHAQRYRGLPAPARFSVSPGEESRALAPAEVALSGSGSLWRRRWFFHRAAQCGVFSCLVPLCLSGNKTESTCPRRLPLCASVHVRARLLVPAWLVRVCVFVLTGFLRE